jgi:hypothetical protein
VVDREQGDGAALADHLAPGPHASGFFDIVDVELQDATVVPALVPKHSCRADLVASLSHGPW